MTRSKVRWQGGRAWLSSLIGAVILATVILLAPPAGRAQGQTARIGVLAYRGTAVALARWQPLVDYLSAEIPGWRFELVPVTLVTAAERLQANELDFVITNPGHYITLAERFPLSALATQERRDPGQARGLLRFGTVIFVRADHTEIQTLADLKGKTLVAVSPDAFGGFQMAWYEFVQQGIDPFKDLKAIRYTGFPQDAIAREVLSGSADAGVVRTGLLEALAREGGVKLEDFKVLLANTQVGFPYLASSRLYPEWPFAVRGGTDRRLAEAVAVALLTTQKAGVAARYGLIDLWSAPLSYEGVRAVISAYQAEHEGTGAPQSPLVANPWNLVALALALLLAGFALGSSVRWWSARAQPAATDRSAVRGAAQDARRARFEKLTRREREILSLICRGEPTKRIAEQLSISPKTVEYHRANLLHKTKARSTPRMVQLATRFGFDQVPSLGETR